MNATRGFAMPSPDADADGEADADALGDALAAVDALGDSEEDADGPALSPLFELPQPASTSTIMTTNTKLALHVLLIFFIPFLPDSLIVGRFGVHQ